MENNKTRPTHRVSFARIIGQDENGNDKLGSTREIGAIWPRKNGGGMLFCQGRHGHRAQVTGINCLLAQRQQEMRLPGLRASTICQSS